MNDVLEYWFGAYVYAGTDGVRRGRQHLRRPRHRRPVHRRLVGLQRPRQRRQPGQRRLVHRDQRHPAGGPSSRSSRAGPSAKYDKPGGPFEPHTGSEYVYSQIADVTYKRLTREITVPAGGGNLTFWTSYDTEAAWDHLFVEARNAGQDNWTTLPDANGHTNNETGPQLPRGLERPASAPGPLPDVGRRDELHRHRHDRCVERGVRQLRRLAAVERQPGRLRRGDGRDLDRLRERLVDPEPGRVPRRHRRGPAGSTSFEGEDRRLDDHRPAEGSAPNANNFVRTDGRRLPGRCRRSRPPTRS